MIYPIYKSKRCRRRDQIGMYDDSGFVYKGRRLTPEGQPPEDCLVGCFDREGRIFRDAFRQSQMGELTETGGVYTLHPVTGRSAQGYVDGDGRGWKGVSHDVLGVCVPQGQLRPQAAAAALILLRSDLPADAKGRFADLPRWLETVVDVALDLADLVMDFVTS